jgi:acyl-CoA dehydrogenase
MSDIGMIEDTARRTIADGLTTQALDASEQGAWAGALWERLENQGLTRPAAIAEGGAGEGLEIEAAVLRAAAGAALPLPLAETAIASWMLGQHGLDVPTGPLTVASFAPHETLTVEADRVSGRLEGVAWGRNAAAIVAVASGNLVLLDRESAAISVGANLASEPRDTLVFSKAPPLAIGGTADAEALLCRCAAVRALQLAEAAGRVLEIAVEYAGQRKQFGKPIGGFQAIQHQLATAASEVASARVAAQQAYLALAARRNIFFACAIAKARANDAAGAVARIGHQVHGAIGFTREYPLHRYTRRIQSWRGEYGASAYWNRRLGELMLGAKERSLWSIVVSGI